MRPKTFRIHSLVSEEEVDLGLRTALLVLSEIHTPECWQRMEPQGPAVLSWVVLEERGKSCWAERACKSVRERILPRNQRLFK